MYKMTFKKRPVVLAVLVLLCSVGELFILPRESQDKMPGGVSTPSQLDQPREKISPLDTSRIFSDSSLTRRRSGTDK